MEVGKTKMEMPVSKIVVRIFFIAILISGLRLRLKVETHFRFNILFGISLLVHRERIISTQFSELSPAAYDGLPSPSNQHIDGLGSPSYNSQAQPDLHLNPNKSPTTKTSFNPYDLFTRNRANPNEEFRLQVTVGQSPKNRNTPRTPSLFFVASVQNRPL